MMPCQAIYALRGQVQYAVRGFRLIKQVEVVLMRRFAKVSLQFDF
jgi:hypothetical protein